MKRAAGGLALHGGRFARQQWRARIETSRSCRSEPVITDSPASNGGRGLKRVPANAQACANTDSPASNGGRGLKLPGRRRRRHASGRFARQQWRARIETAQSSCVVARRSDSPASNGGRGLKLQRRWPLPRSMARFARQQWRARIETWRCSPGIRLHRDSPASNGGRGLKPHHRHGAGEVGGIRPPAMAGAD